MELQHVSETLGGLGLTEKEIGVYLSLVTHGGIGSTIEVAAYTGIPRTSVYDVLLSLQRKGVVVEKRRKNTKIFSVETPSHLLAILHKQEALLASTKQKLKSTVADLESLMSPALPVPSLRQFHGEEGIVKMWEEQLLATTQLEAFNIFCTHEFLARFQPWLQEKSRELLPHGVQVKVLVNSPSEDPIFIKIRNFEVKASNHTYVFAAGMNVLGDFIGFWNEMHSLTGMLMENAHIARMQRVMFDQAWTNTPA
ncbi:hypothetical protein COW46_00370 [Candidatus Gracilibacteria bacterium CG17_big_fil_post_rev_8_21_14_2_50_48_13]|nr:MAG: hypothetical protein COW46_00370 [Candidatus Gracilibacteria bacterium CG17_big_fil_post_rev_8_21_14_2_50_48_13]